MPCSSNEKKYAHYVGEASWAGARIIQGQWTPQAQKLYDLLILTFSENGKLADLAALQEKSGIAVSDWEDLLQYTSQVRVSVLSRPSTPSPNPYIGVTVMLTLRGSRLPHLGPQ